MRVQTSTPALNPLRAFWCVVQPGQAGVDQLFADDGVVSSGDEHGGPQRAQRAYAFEVGLDEAVPVPP
jgi:hypothetical protein